MSYSITTKDGITVENIPDDVPPDDQSLKDRVARARAAGGGTPAAVNERDALRSFRQSETAPLAAPKPPATLAPIVGPDGKPMSLDPTEGMSTLGKFGVGIQAGVEDKLLGLRQFANSISGGRIGDEAQLKEQAAEKAKFDAPLTSGAFSAGGMGQTVGTLLPDLLIGGPAGGLAKAAAAKVATKFLPAIAQAATMGAASEVTNPHSNYRLGTEAAKGAVGGLAGDAVARGLAFALRPMRGAVNAKVQEAVDVLKAKYGDTMIAENLTDNKFVKMLSNALAQLGPAGAGVNKARDANLGTYTESVTGATGYPTRVFTEEAKRAAQDRLGGQAAGFRAGPDVPIGDIAPMLQSKLDEILAVNALTGKGAQGERALRSAIGEATPTMQIQGAQQPRILSTLETAAGEQPGPNIMRTLEQAGAEGPIGGKTYGGVTPNISQPPLVPNIPTITANQAVTARGSASNSAYEARLAGKSTEKDAFRALRSQLEDALTATHPDEGAAFRKWKGEHGALQDAFKAGTTPEGTILPENFLKTLEKGPARTDLARETVAASERMASPSLAENRSLAVRLLTGAALTGGTVLGGVPGAAAGAGTLGLAHLLLGTPAGGRYLTGQTNSKLAQALQSQELKDRLLQVGAAAGGQMTHERKKHAP